MDMAADRSGYLLGIDIGTTNVKVVLVERSDLEVVHKHSQPLEELESVPTPNASERSVGQIFRALESCMVGLEEKVSLKEVKGIGVCGQMHGCVLWSSTEGALFSSTEGRLQHRDGATSNLITCEDGRCSSEFLSTLPQIPHLPHPHVSTGYGCATLAWLWQEDREMVMKYNRAGCIMDMVVCALCSGGKGDVVMSSQNAVSWGYFDMSALCWCREILEASFPAHLLPPVVRAPAIAGHLVADWHGIPQGTTIAVAMGDLQCSVLATQPTPSDAVLNMGTASQLAVVKPCGAAATASPLPESILEVPYFNGDHLLVAASLNGGNVIATFVDVLQGWIQELGVDLGGREVRIYDKLLRAALGKLGTPLKVNPRLRGERHAPDERGSVWNIQAGNLSLGDVGSAMVRGLVENLRKMMPQEIFKQYQVNRVLGSGKTLQNPAFQEHIKQVFGLPFDLSEGADSPLGAAVAVRDLLTHSEY